MVTLLMYLLTVLAGRNLITTLSKISTSDILEIIIALLVFMTLHSTHTFILVSSKLFHMCYLDAYNNSVSEVVYTHAYTDTHIHAHMCTQDIKDLAGQTCYPQWHSL